MIDLQNDAQKGQEDFALRPEAGAFPVGSNFNRRVRADGRRWRRFGNRQRSGQERVMVLDHNLLVCGTPTYRSVRFEKERRAQCIWNFEAPVAIEGFSRLQSMF